MPRLGFALVLAALSALLVLTTAAHAAPVFGALGAWIASGLTAIGVSATAAGLIAQGIVLLVPVALSIGLSALLKPKIPQPEPSKNQIELRQPVPNRKIHYGTVKVSGPLAFFAAANDPLVDMVTLFQVVLISARPIGGFQGHYLNDKEVTVGAVRDHFVDDDQYWKDGTPRAELRWHTGEENQTADDRLIECFPDQWTNAHRLRGIAYAVCVFRQAGNKFVDIYPNGKPEYAALINSSLLYDPRKDSTNGGTGAHRLADPMTWEFSDNAVLATADWLTWDRGFGLPANRIYWPDVIAKANLADEEVTLKAGGTEKRYRVAMTVDLAGESRSDILNRLLSAWDGRIVRHYSSGKIGFKGGEWEAPDVTLSATEGHIIEAEIANGVSAPELYNELSFRYMSPVHGYIEVEGDPWQDNTIEMPGGGFKTQSIDFLHVPSHAQSRRLAKIVTARDNPPFIGEIRRTNVKGIDVLGAEVITLNVPELDVSGAEVSGPFWIDGGVRVFGDCSGVSMTVKAARSNIYNWNAATEEGTEPPVPPPIDDDIDEQWVMLGAGGGDTLGAGGVDVLGGIVQAEL